MKLSERRKELPDKKLKKRQECHLRPSFNSKEKETLKQKKIRAMNSIRKKIL